MNTHFWKWRAHRIMIDRFGHLTPFTNRSDLKKVLIVSERDKISKCQVFPFFYYGEVLAAEYGIEIRELPLARFLSGEHPYHHQIDAVLFQTWFDLDAEALTSLLDRILRSWPNAKLAYLDWFAPTDLRYAEILHPHIAAYVKKQILKDFSLYEIPTTGDTNLVHYYSHRFNLDQPINNSLCLQDLRKNSSWDPTLNILRSCFKILNVLLSATAAALTFMQDSRRKEFLWYSKMRHEASTAVTSLNGQIKVAHDGWLKPSRYLRELRNSKLCFSPFGYGEVCWRDYEAMSSGAMLLKPDMAHLTLAKDHFRPFETYVPLSWDLSDFRDKVEYYLHHEAERTTIARNAFEQLRVHYRERQFPRDMLALWKLLDIAPAAGGKFAQQGELPTPHLNGGAHDAKSL